MGVWRSRSPEWATETAPEVLWELRGCSVFLLFLLYNKTIGLLVAWRGVSGHLFTAEGGMKQRFNVAMTGLIDEFQPVGYTQNKNISFLIT
jgi:hypothetical protein